MTPKAEQQVRDALRRQGDAVTPAMLRYRDELRSGVAASRPRGRNSWLAPVAAVAAVLLIVVVAVVVRGGGSGSTPTADQTATRSLAGTTWRLIAVGDPAGRTITIPERVSAGGITFERGGGELVAQDGVNTHSGRYSINDRGELVPGPIYTSAIGYAGNDQAILAAVAGVGAVLSGGVVTVQVDPGELRLAASGFTLTFGDEELFGTSSAPADKSSGMSSTFPPDKQTSGSR